MSENANTQGIVLKSYDAAEFDQNVILYSVNFGKISVLAKGIRSQRSKRRGIVQSGNIVTAQLLPFGDRFILQESRLDLSADWFVSSSALSGVIFHVLELIDIFAQGVESHSELVWLYARTLIQFRSSPRMLLVRVFELKLLKILGYFPVFQLVATYREREDLAVLMEELVNLELTEVEGVDLSKDLYSRLESFLSDYLESVAERKLYSRGYFS